MSKQKKEIPPKEMSNKTQKTIEEINEILGRNIEEKIVNTEKKDTLKENLAKINEKKQKNKEIEQVDKNLEEKAMNKLFGLEDKEKGEKQKEDINKLFGIGDDKERIKKLQKEVEAMSIPEAEAKLEKARERYIEEYKKGKKETSKKALVGKTKDVKLNILTGIKNLFNKDNKIDYRKSKKEDYISEEEKEAKKEYTKARIEMGDAMYKQKKAELEKAGLSDEELEIALSQYKATEILAKTILDERQKMIEGKTENPTLLRKLLNGYTKMKPRWKKIALSIALSAVVLGVAGATGGVSGSVIAGNIAHMTLKRVVKSSIAGGLSGYLAKGIDFKKRKSDAKFLEEQTVKKDSLKEQFSRNEIGLEEYEKGISKIETDEYKRLRNRMLLKAGIGIAISGSVGFAYGSLDNVGEIHIEGKSLGYSNEIPSGTKEAFIPVNEQNITEHTDIVTAEKGDGGIFLARKIQDELIEKYGKDWESNPNVPNGAKEALGMKDHELAKHWGLYKPNETAESAVVKVGDQIKFDEETGKAMIFNKEGSAELNENYTGKMFDYNKMSSTENLKEENMFKLPTQIDPETGKPILIEGELEHTDHGGEGSIFQIKDIRGSVDMKFIYDEDGNITKAQMTGNYNNTGLEPSYYLIESSQSKLDSVTQLNLQKEINKITFETRFLNSIHSDSPEHNFLQEQIIKRKQEIIDRSNGVLDFEKLQIHETYSSNIRHLFPTEKSINVWNDIKNNTSAEKLMELSSEEKLDSNLKPLASYINKLQEITGLHPEGKSIFKEAESIPHFINRAIKTAREMGEGDKVKL